ncbi:hypothetical protein [Kineococcus sp. NPDC059986]|uniref:hypothetical protein n=1 Tax=Actinomycetes TaxID=1760 RepID=UPI00344E321E
MSNARVFASEPERMTTRAQLYLIATGAANLTLAVFLFFRPGDFTSTSYDSIKLVASLPVWGVGLALVGLVCLAGAILKREGLARLGAALAALAAGSWAFGFVAAAFIGSLMGPSGPVSWTLLTIFHLLQCRSPLRLPLEPILRRLAANRR